jgi:hypothetical protein
MPWKENDGLWIGANSRWLAHVSFEGAISSKANYRYADYTGTITSQRI